MLFLRLLIPTFIYSKLAITQVEDLKDAPQVYFAHDFPRTTQSRLVIDAKALVRINMTNESPLTKTVFKMTGYLTDKDDASKVIRKIHEDKVQYVIKQGKTVNLKYIFTPQVESGNLGFLVVVEYYDSDEPAYKSIGCLQVVDMVYEDPKFDLQRYF